MPRLRRSDAYPGIVEWHDPRPSPLTEELPTAFACNLTPPDQRAALLVE